MDHVHALHRDGLHGLLDSVEQHSVHAPLVPLLTVPLLLVSGEGVGPGFVVVACFDALLIIASYAVARRLVDPWPSALVALLVATTPQVIELSRTYYFAIPAAALFAVAVWCFLVSDAMARPAWAIGGGVALGLAVLARTMVLPLAVGLLLAALLQSVARRDRLRIRLVTLAAATGAAVAVAATWYGPNITAVLDHLRGVRFRDPSSGADPYHRLPGFRQVGQLSRTLQIPLAALLVTVAATAALVAWQRHREHRLPTTRRSPGTALVRWLATDRAFLVVVIVEAVIVYALADEAFGEWIMILPFGLALAVYGLTALPRGLRQAFAPLLVTVAVFNLVMTGGIVGWLGRERVIHAGPFGPLPITDGRQYMQRFLAPTGNTGDPGRMPASLRAFRPEQTKLAEWMLDYAARHGQRPVVLAVGNESRLLNINDLLLADRLIEDDGTLITGRLFVAPDAPRRAYEQLDDPRFGLPNFLMTYSSTGDGRDAPLTRQEHNIQSRGFDLVRAVPLPDALARIWWRSQAEAT